MPETEISASTETVVTPAIESGSPAPESVAPASGTPAAPEVKLNEGAIATPAAPAAYAPNLKFKVLDKEHEIDPLFAGVIKDADTEKKVRELFEKAYGLDSVKADRQSLKQKIETHYAPLEQTHQNTVKALAQFDKMIEQKDYDNFFGTLQIPEEEILKWAVKKAQLMSLTPEERQAYNESVQQRNRLYSLEQQVADSQEAQFQIAVQTRTAQLDQELSKPEILNVIDAYDGRVGTPGAFKAEVIKRGQLYAYQGKDISVEEAVREVIGLMGVNAQAPVAPQQVQQPVNNSAGNGQGTAPQAQAPSQKPPVIPNVGGQGTSPAKKVVRSLDDIRALSKQMN